MDPITLGIVGILGLGGWLVARNRGRTAAPPPPATTCNDAAAAQAVAGTAVAGAGAGASTGPVGIGIGAGLGLALGAGEFLSTPCGTQFSAATERKIAQLGKDICTRADDLVKQANALGIATPLGWDNMSCDQRIAAITAALTPAGFVLAAGDEIVSTGAAAANRTDQNLTATTTKAGGGHVTVGGHKIF